MWLAFDILICLILLGVSTAMLIQSIRGGKHYDNR